VYTHIYTSNGLNK